MAETGWLVLWKRGKGAVKKDWTCSRFRSNTPARICWGGRPNISGHPTLYVRAPAQIRFFTVCAWTKKRWEAAPCSLEPDEEQTSESWDILLHMMSDECFWFLLGFEGLPTFHQKSWQYLLYLKENFVSLHLCFIPKTTKLGIIEDPYPH